MQEALDLQREVNDVIAELLKVSCFYGRRKNMWLNYRGSPSAMHVKPFGELNQEEKDILAELVKNRKNWNFKMTSVFDLFSLKGKTAFVTGAYAWIGWDISCALAEAGADVVISSRDQEKLTMRQRGLKKEFPGISTMGVSMDQCSAESVDAAFKKVHQWKGKLDILVNNAVEVPVRASGTFSKGLPRISRPFSEPI